MVEIAARWVTVYPKIANGFGTTINTAATKAGVGAGKSLGDAASAGASTAFAKSAPKISSTFKSVLAPVLTLGAAAAVSGFVRKAVNDFSDLEDATGAAGVVFGESMDKIIAKGETAAATLGMSKAQIIDAANTFGTLGKSAKLTGDDLADFSNEMTDVAGSLSSFKGGSPEEAILAVGAALRGESEPIRRYGILLDDATLRQRAMTMGIVDNIKTALNPQQRVLAAQAEILAQSGDAMGDFERTANSTANVQKTLAAESANLSAELGEKLAPMIVEAQKAGIGFLRWTSDNAEALIPLVKLVGLAAAAVGTYVAAAKGLEAVRAAKVIITDLGNAFQGMSTKARIATATAGAAAVAITAATVVYGAFAKRNAEATAVVEAFTAALEASNGALDENVRKTAAKHLMDQGAFAAAEQLGISVRLVTDAAMGNADALDQVRRRLVDVRAAEADAIAAGGSMDLSLRDNEQSAGALETALGIVSTGLDDAIVKQRQMETATADAAKATETQLSTVAVAKVAYDEYTKAIQTTYSAQLKLAGSERAAEAAYDAGKARVKEWTAELTKKYEAEIKADAAAKGRKVTDEEVAKQAKKRAKDEVAAAIASGKALDINTAAGRKNEEALYGIAESTLAAIGNMTDLEKANGTAADRADRGRKKFIELAKQFGVGADEAEDLADKMGLLKSKDIDFTVKVKWSGDLNKEIRVNGSSVKFSAKAVGGPIIGGVPGKDSVPIMAMPDEHMLTVRDVKNLGGHAAVYRLRALAAAGALRYADGGPVPPFTSTTGAAAGVPVAESLADVLEAAVARALEGARMYMTITEARLLSDKIGGEIRVAVERRI